MVCANSCGYSRRKGVEFSSTYFCKFIRLFISFNVDVCFDFVECVMLGTGFKHLCHVCYDGFVCMNVLQGGVFYMCV